jgi:hypothetical protein
MGQSVAPRSTKSNAVPDSLEVEGRIHDIFRVQGALSPQAKEITWPIGKTRKRPA